MTVDDVLSLAAVIVAAVAAGFAWWQASEARKSRVRAEAAEAETAELAARATAAAERQAAAQEHANRLEEAARAPRPWGEPRWISGDTYSVTNTSGRVIEVDRWEVEPDGAERFFKILTATGSDRFDVGDSFDYMYSPKMPVRARKLTVHWRFEGADEERQYIIPL